MLLNNADNVFLGAAAADAVYCGSALVWQRAAETFSFWLDSEAPDTGGNAGGRGPAINVGLEFYVTVDCYAVGLRFYRWSSSTLPHTGSLFNTPAGTGSLIQAVSFVGETASGWQTQMFPTPIPLTAGTHYVASIYAPDTVYCYDFSTTSRYFPATRGEIAGVMQYYDFNGVADNPGNADGSQYYTDVILQTGVVAPPSFSPADLPGLTVWLDASQLSGTADGAPIAVWPDLSGTGNDGNVVGSPGPAYRHNSLNGLPVVRFTVGEGRIRGDHAGTLDYTVSYVVRCWALDGDGRGGRAFSTPYPGTNATNFLIGYHLQVQDAMYDPGTGWINSGVDYGAMPGPWKLYTGSGDGTSYFYINQVLSGSGASVGLGDGYCLSGVDPTSTGETMSCEVAEFTIYDRRLTDDERGQLETYLQAKWGL
jgi:hypothetical protein